MGFVMEYSETWLVVFKNLLKRQMTQFSIDGQTLSIEFGEHVNCYLITIPVYYGHNFIPKSVRQSVSETAPLVYEQGLQTYLKIDERKCQIHLCYLGSLEELSLENIKEIIEEFLWIGEEWRSFLEEQGYQDLVHVSVKK
jgi:hypothetical protein